MHVNANFMKDIFLFSSPDLYFKTVQYVIMLIALYLALWLVIFASADVGYWKAIAIAPALLSVVNYLYVVKTASLLKALCSVDYEALDQVFQQTDESRVLGQSIRQKLLAKMQLPDAADSKNFSREELQIKAQAIFREIDYDNGGLVNRSEFSLYLSRMGISLNRKQWKETFRHIDLDGSELLSFLEFFAFIFPEHQEAIQNQLLESLQKRLDQHSCTSLSESSSPTHNRFDSLLISQPARMNSIALFFTGSNSDALLPVNRGKVVPSLAPPKVNEEGDDGGRFPIKLEESAE